VAREPSIAKRYAQALFNVALKKDALDVVAADMQAVVALNAKDASFRLFLESPQVRDDHKHELVDTILGTRVNRVTAEFVHLLLHKKRFPYLGMIATQFDALVEAHRGIEKVRVTSAIALTEAESAGLVRELEALSGKSIRLQPRVEPEILGGVIVQLGDQIIDRSVRSLLDQMREDLLNVPVA
jgi:F-type H+-transporting ATPase subunit delta